MTTKRFLTLLLAAIGLVALMALLFRASGFRAVPASQTTPEPFFVEDGSVIPGQGMDSNIK